ncbi:unnamed protein product [Dicrocoelium dendriticum]|nr:unnamed protein product [Dicrocoelium dendriticum]
MLGFTARTSSSIADTDERSRAATASHSLNLTTVNHYEDAEFKLYGAVVKANVLLVLSVQMAKPKSEAKRQAQT